MSYEEIIEGESIRRGAPDARHEAICARLHAVVAASLASVTSARLLAPRTVVQLAPGTLVRPDLALVTAASAKLWLAAEVISAADHRADTVLKKELYEQLQLPRLWMVDLRYDNLEVYHGGPHGLALQHIHAGRETVTEQLLPQLRLTVADLFAAAVG